MARTITLLLLLSLSLVRPVAAATYWVGNSANCSGAGVFASLNSALFAAGFNGDSSDEIRLTNTRTYSGNTDGNYTLTDWTAAGPGALTIAGGYSDCFAASPTILTDIGNTANPIFTIDTNLQSFSEVTLKHLLLNSSEDRAIIARSGAVVSLENVIMLGNNGGIAVEAGAFVDVDSGSRIELGGGGVTVNGFVGDVTHGGGIHCSGANASIRMAGDMYYNGALQAGGHIYVGNGCFVELLDGVRIRGSANQAAGESPPLDPDAPDGGGIYVDNGGQLHARGRANRVIIHDLSADNGGALYLNGTGFAILENTHFDNNEAMEGAAIFATGSGSALQLSMDRTADCPLSGLACSEIQNSRHHGTVVHVDNSLVQIQRTMIERSVDIAPDPNRQVDALLSAHNGAKMRLNRVGIIDNEAYAVLGLFGGTVEATHLTIAANVRPNGTDPYFFADGAHSNYRIDVQNSLVDNTNGTDRRGIETPTAEFVGKCNLIDVATNGFAIPSGWPAGSYTIGAPDFVNIAGNDPHQIDSSDGVDMCQQDTFVWSTEVDIDMQSAPVNVNTNPQGMPGEVGGLFDAGFDEVYANIGEDEFTLTIHKQGTGSGVVISNPSGISCGSDCDEVYFNGTIVTLNAAPVSGSVFIDWFNCPLVNQPNQCLVNMTTSHTIRAEFSTGGGDGIFSDGFE